MGKRYLIDTNVLIEFQINLLPVEAQEFVASVIDAEFNISVINKIEILGSKSVQGTLAAFVVCALLTALYLGQGRGLSDRMILISLLGGIIGALAELIPVWDLDDNLTLPLLSASGLWILFLLFGGF